MSLAVSFEPQVQTIFPSRFRRPRQKWYLRAAGLKGGKHSATCATATLAEFEGLRSRRGDVHLCAFDLLELDGRDLRLEPLTERRRLLARLIRNPRSGLVLNAQFKQDGPLVFEHACLLGCE